MGSKNPPRRILAEPPRERQTDSRPAIRPFQVGFSEAELADLRKRISATRWPERETVADDSQGVALQTMQDLARYWGTDYDWRQCEAKLNALPNFITEIDGLDRSSTRSPTPHPTARVPRMRSISSSTRCQGMGSRASRPPSVGTRYGLRAPGPSARIATTSCTSTRSTKAATSRPGISRNCSRRRCARASERCANSGHGSMIVL